MQSIHFENNPAYAVKAFENRSMFNRDYYMLLLYVGHCVNVDPQIRYIKDAVGEATLLDLTWRLPAYFFKKTIAQAVDKAYKAFKACNPRVVDPGAKTACMHYKNILNIPKFLWRAICVPFTVIGAIILHPANMIYGLLDTFSLWVAQKAYEYSRGKYLKRDDRQHYTLASKVALSVSLLTMLLRLPAGLVEAIQEPFHLYDFWIKGWGDAWHDYKIGLHSGPVCAIKLLLHVFKVVCTLGAILSIVGITMIPFISQAFHKLGKTAEYLNVIKDKVPGRKYFLEAPINALKDTIVGVEKGVENVFGFNNSYFSEKTNAAHAIELGFEAGLSKPAEMLPRNRTLKTFTPSYDNLYASSNAASLLGLDYDDESMRIRV